MKNINSNNRLVIKGYKQQQNIPAGAIRSYGTTDFADGLSDYTEIDSVRDRWLKLKEQARPDIKGDDGPVLLIEIIIALVALAAVIILPYLL